MSVNGLEHIRGVVLSALEDPLRPLGISVDEVDGSTDLLASGLLDSLAMVDLLVAVEEVLPISLEDIDFDQVGTLNSLVHELARLQVEEQSCDGG